MTIIIICALSVFIILNVLFTLFITNRKNGSYLPIKLDQYTTEFYTDELDKIIQYKTIYHIDKAFGKSFSMNKSVSSDIDNDTIAKAHEEIIEDIFNTVSIEMKNYLVSIYGDKWFVDYIRINTLSILLNYEKYTVNSLTEDKFE